MVLPVSAVRKCHYMLDVLRAYTAMHTSLEALAITTDQVVSQKFSDLRSLREEEDRLLRKMAEGPLWRWWHLVSYSLATGATALCGWTIPAATTAFSVAKMVNSQFDEFTFGREQGEIFAQIKEIDGKRVMLLENSREAVANFYSQISACDRVTKLVSGLVD